jgi:polyisoprenoid-binding protein YceI
MSLRCRNRRMIVGLFAAALAQSSPALASGWTVDPARSSLGFRGDQSGTPFSGRFSRWRAEIEFDPARPAAGHARIVIDMSSATTGDGQKDISLPQSDWFDLKHFPQAVFEAVRFHAKGGNAYEAEGSLTIKGVRRRVILPFTFVQHGCVGHASGSVELLRLDFHIGEGPWASGQMVGLGVAVTLDVTATRR